MHFDKISSGVVDLLTIYAFCLTISEAGKILKPTLPRKKSIKYQWTFISKIHLCALESSEQST